MKEVLWSEERVKCDLCSYNWVAVYPQDIERLECPNCSNMVYYEIEN